jgi:hypothetical protein
LTTSQSYEFKIYNYNASVVLGYGVYQSRRKYFCFQNEPGYLDPIYDFDLCNDNATGSLARFENQNILLYSEKRSSLGTTTLAL